jgi:ATP-dependent RNA helicase RhlB
VHRIGRTARAGAEGDAISLGCEDYVQSLPDIEDYIGRKIPVASVAQELLAEITIPRYERRSFGGPGGGPRGGRGGHGGGSGRGGAPRGGGGRGGPRSGGPRRDGGHGRPAAAHAPHQATSPAPAAPAPQGPPAATGEAPTGADGAPRKRRRRGGRGRSGRPQGEGTAPQDTGGNQGPGADS